MIVEVKLFAVARQLTGQDCVQLTLAEGARLVDLQQALLAEHPELSELGSHLKFAINHEYAASLSPIPPDAEIACIPPVSGG